MKIRFYSGACSNGHRGRRDFLGGPSAGLRRHAARESRVFAFCLAWLDPFYFWVVVLDSLADSPAWAMLPAMPVVPGRDPRFDRHLEAVLARSA